MKTALVSEWVDPWRGGAETSTLQFLHKLLEHGVEVHLFTRSRPAAVPGLTIRHVGGAAMTRTRRSMTFAHRVARILKHESFDLRHAITPCANVDLYQPRGGTIAESIERNLALVASDGLRMFKKLTNRINFKQRHALRLERRLLRDPNGPVIVALSDYVVRQLKRHYGLSDDRIRKVFNGIDPPTLSESERLRVRRALRSEFGIQDDELLVLMVAHNFKLKGVGRWMDALSLLQSRGVTNIRSLVVGKGDDPRWHRRAASLGVGRHLQFVGGSNRVADFYHAADVLVHPTYYDPCSRVLLEAMIAGLPCVASPWDGSSEVVENGVNGYLLSDPNNVEELADLVLLLSDRGRRQSIGSQAARIINRVSIDRHTEQILRIYREFASSPRELCAVD